MTTPKLPSGAWNLPPGVTLRDLEGPDHTEDFLGPPDLLSDCCGAVARGELCYGSGPPLGTCSSCLNQTSFNYVEEEV